MRCVIICGAPYFFIEVSLMWLIFMLVFCLNTHFVTAKISLFLNLAKDFCFKIKVLDKKVVTLHPNLGNTY